MRQLLLLSFALICVARSVSATDLGVTEVAIDPGADAKTAVVRFTAGWRHAWRNARNHDAAWMVVKVRAGGAWRHAPLAAGVPPRLGAAGTPSATFQVPPDRIGAFVFAAAPHRGDVRWQIEMAVDRGFYIMKYELLQGQYADFLNTLYSEHTYFRAIHGGVDYDRHRGSIRLANGVYVADAPRRPANRVSWEDGIAFADWAGLRPMTELEFTKAARGPSAPVPHEYPWGSGTKESLRRVMQPDDDLATTGDADEGRLSDATRGVLGASYYWVMDLAGSVWERAVTIGHPIGRAFRGSHGDGRLSDYGSATNDDWPRGDEAPGGYGYRGGGYYEQGMVEREFNPYSPIAYRRFGSWGQAPRSLAYGFRAVRTAPDGAPDSAR